MAVTMLTVPLPDDGVQAPARDGGSHARAEVGVGLRCSDGGGCGHPGVLLQPGRLGRGEQPGGAGDGLVLLGADRCVVVDVLGHDLVTGPRGDRRCRRPARRQPVVDDAVAPSRRSRSTTMVVRRTGHGRWPPSPGPGPHRRPLVPRPPAGRAAPETLASGRGAGILDVASAGATADDRSVIQWTRAPGPLLASFAGMTRTGSTVGATSGPFSGYCHGRPWWNPRP